MVDGLANAGEFAGQLTYDVAAGIRVLTVRDGLQLSEEQILERARNIVAGLLGNYRIESLEGDPEAVGAARHHPSGSAATLG